MISFDVDQADWGSTVLWDDYTHGAFAPRYVVVHWGGTTNQVSPDGEAATLRGWQRYHMTTKKMKNIAYNFAIGDSGTVYRLRGMNSGGGSKADAKTPEGDYWNDAAVAVVWIGGANDADGPSPAALAAFEKLCDEVYQYDVLGHQQTGKATACPGPDLLAWVASYNERKELMPKVLWDQMIRAFFEADGEFQGDPEYWVDLDPNDPQWATDFFPAMVRMLAGK